MSKKEWWVYDIETYPTFFCANFYRIGDGKKISFQIGTEGNSSEYISLKRFYLDKNKVLVGFNIIGFDHPVLMKMFQRSSKIGSKTIKKIADRIIASGGRPVNDSRLVDLYKIMHFDNKNKRVGLKTIEGVIQWRNIQDLPFHHNKMINEEEAKVVVEYCWNDVLATLEFFKEIKEVVRFNLKAKQLFDLPDHNWSPSKIGEFIVLKGYEKRTGKKPIKNHNPTKTIQVKDILADYVKDYKWKHESLKGLVKELEETTLKVLETGKIGLSDGSKFEKTLSIEGKHYDMKVGGLHSVDDPNLTIPAKDEIIIDRDVSSLYPYLIKNLEIYPEHLGIEFLYEYVDILETRIYNKKRRKDQTISREERSIASMFNDILKLALNSVYGKSNDRYSPLYDPKVTMKVTINGQLSLLMLIDMAVDKGIKILSANTDGVLFHINNSQKADLDQVCKDWMEVTKLRLDDEIYSKFYQRDVNNYIAVKKDGTTKEKGKYEVDKYVGDQKAYHKNFSMRVVPLSIREWLTKNRSIQDTIFNHDVLYDFCLLMRAKKAPKKGESSFFLRTKENQKKLDLFLKEREREYRRLKKEGKTTEEISVIKNKEKKDFTDEFNDKPIGKSIRVIAVDEDGSTQSSGILVKKFSNGTEALIYKDFVFADLSLLEKDTSIKKFDIDFSFYIEEAEKLLITN